MGGSGREIRGRGKKGKGKGRAEEVEEGIWSTQKFWRGAPYVKIYSKLETRKLHAHKFHEYTSGSKDLAVKRLYGIFMGYSKLVDGLFTC